MKKTLLAILALLVATPCLAYGPEGPIDGSGHAVHVEAAVIEAPAVIPVPATIPAAQARAVDAVPVTNATAIQPTAPAIETTAKCPEPRFSTPQLRKAWTLYNIGKYRQVIGIVTPLAEKGDPEAQTILGDCYENGLGVGIAPEIAAKWYQLAAAQLYPPALRKLGYALNAGNGVPMDFRKAVDCMVSAAMAGDCQAMRTLRIWDMEGRISVGKAAVGPDNGRMDVEIYGTEGRQARLTETSGNGETRITIIAVD